MGNFEWEDDLDIEFEDLDNVECEDLELDIEFFIKFCDFCKLKGWEFDYLMRIEVFIDEIYVLLYLCGFIILK